MKLAAFVLGSIPLIIQFYARQYLEEDRTHTLKELENDVGLPRIATYDFIVVGAGTAGCVIAGRLSEKFNVLLLEAGGNPVPASQVPMLNGAVASDIETNYRFPSVPQPNASQRTGGIITTETGKMLGGSGSHNDMVHNRASPHDYENYAKITNDDSWSYENVLEYFKKSENFIGQLFTDDSLDSYGKEGLLTVDTDTPAILSKWFDAGAELGFQISDPNGFQVESFAPMAKLIENGQRVSTYNRYIKPIRETRANLTVLPYSVASQILIDSNNRAYGVVYERHGIPQISHASKEVIVSAGTYSSPLLLMKSGIGDSNNLEEAEIPVKVNLPDVGKNLGDHLVVYLTSITFNSSALAYIPTVPQESEFEDILKEYQETGAGIFGTLQEGPQAFIVSSRAKSEGESQWPDIQLILDPTCPYAQGPDEPPIACMYIEVSRPKFRGSISLNATAYKAGIKDDMELAVVDFNILEGSSASDADVLLEGLQHGLNILENTKAFKEMGAKYSAEPEPGCTSYEFRSEEYWRCFIKQTAYTTYHSVGTCSMGPGTSGVTDSKLRVRGVQNLRVADGSVLPAVPNANINGPIIMVAEKAADEILKSW